MLLSQIEKDWLNPYKASSLQVPWYGVLGNHEYGYNVQAQIDLSEKYPNWVMPSRYYTKRIQLSGDKYASFIFLDTSPCVTEYRASNPKGWDPCGDEYPTCSLSGGTDDFEGTCKFNQNILSQDCGAQLSWFKQQLAKADKDDWLIVVGHHPADDIDEEDFTSALQQHGFDLYLNGHTHCLTQYTVDGSGAYVTSGAGALVLSYDQERGTAAKNRTHDKVNGNNLDWMSTFKFGANVTTGQGGHSFQQVWSAKKSGFTQHTFSSDYTTLTTDFIGTDGSVLHSFTVTKGAKPGPTPPSPPGPPGPGPSPGGCCYYHATTCRAGETCCSSSGKPYKSPSSCRRYGEQHHCQWTDGTCKVPGR